MKKSWCEKLAEPRPHAVKPAPIDIAEAAWEALACCTPIEELTPVWRVLDAASPTLRKLSFDAQFIRDQRAAESLSR